MDDNYYNFTLKHSSIDDGIHLANIESLICLKVKAYLDLANRRNEGEQVDKKHIEKHKKDVFVCQLCLALKVLLMHLIL